VGKSKAKTRGRIPQAKRPKGGRNPLAEEPIVQVGIKLPESLEKQIISKVAELKAKGFKTNKSHLMRTLVVSMLEYAEDVFKELERKQAHDDAHDTNRETAL
jgi:hypothetical protein